MRKNKKIAIICSALSLCLLLTACSDSSSNKETEVTTVAEKQQTFKMSIDKTKTYQTIESFGTSGAWWSQYIGGWDEEYQDSGHSKAEEIAKLLYDKEYGIGLTNYRYNMGAGSADSGNGSYSDKHRRAQSFLDENGKYDWTKDTEAVTFLEQVVKYGAEEVVLFSNSPLETLTTNGMAHMNKEQTDNLPKENYEAFADYVFDVTEHFLDIGIPVVGVSPINEPQWEWTSSQEGCHYEPEQLADVFEVFYEKQKSRKKLKDIEITGPEGGEWKGKTYDYVEEMLSRDIIKENMTTIDNHSYWTNASDKRQFKSWMDKNYPDVELRASEWCEMVNGSDYTMDSAYNLAKVIVEDLTILDVKAWSNWVGVAPGGYRDGLIYATEGSKTIVPLKRLWGYGNYSRFIRPGYQRVDISAAGMANTLNPVAFIGISEEGKEEMVIVIINQAKESKEIDLTFVDQSTYTKAEYHETSDENNLILINETEFQGTVSVNGESITTIILQ